MDVGVAGVNHTIMTNMKTERKFNILSSRVFCFLNVPLELTPRTHMKRMSCYKDSMNLRTPKSSAIRGIIQIVFNVSYILVIVKYFT